MSDETPRIFISSELMGDMGAQMGTAHYSYGVVAERFHRALSRQGYLPVAVKMPEKYKRRVDLGLAFGKSENTSVHMCFRSPENIRPMPAAETNICHFAWEFDVMKDRELISGPITANQKHMLGLMDEIWVPCSFTRDTLKHYGLPYVELVPTPIIGDQLPTRLSKSKVIEEIGPIAAAPLNISSGLPRALNAEIVSGTIDALASYSGVTSWLEGQGRIFLSVCNPHDLRKNILNTIDGFLYAADSNDLLILKFVVGGSGANLDDDPFEHLSKRYRGPIVMHAPNVLAISEFLSEAKMSALYSMADFYLSASHCEGFNLPLLEAMAHGVTPVTTRNTAMCDYIDQHNAIHIFEHSYPGVISGMTSDISGVSAIISVADRFDIAQAIRRAQEMTPDARATMAERARTLAVERYNETVIMRIVEKRLAAIQERRSAQRDAI